MKEDEDLTNTLRLMYAPKLPDKIKSIESQYETLHGAALDSDPFKLFYKTIHQLNGSSGSYGYPEISKAAAELELYLKSIMQNEKYLSESQEIIIKEMVQKIKIVIEAAILLNSSG